MAAKPSGRRSPVRIHKAPMAAPCPGPHRVGHKTSTIARARSGSDADSLTLRIAGALAAVVAASAFLDLQPLAIHALATFAYPVTLGNSAPEPLFVTLFTPFAGKTGFSGVPLVAFATAISASGNLLGAFLAASRNAKDGR